MPVLIKKKYKNKNRWHIVENKTTNGMLHREYLENLGEITKSEAKIELAKWLSLNKKGSGNKILVEQALKKFETYYQGTVGQNIRQKTFDLFSGNSRKLSKYLGLEEIRKVDFDMIESLKIKLTEEGLSNRTVNMILTDLKKVFLYCEKMNWIREVPSIKRLSEVKYDKEIDALNKEEVDKLMMHANPKQSTYLKLMLFSGIRPFEASNLTWENISFEDEYIDIISNNKLKPGRRIPLHSKLKIALKGLDRVSDFVSPYLDSSYARKSMKRLEVMTGIKCNPCKLRRTFGSLLAQAGEDTLIVAKLMGHSKLQTTYKYYIRLNDESLRKTIENL